MQELPFTEKFELTELTNKLFMCTDATSGSNYLMKCFQKYWFDMDSAGGRILYNVKGICEM